jgi:hypothetical protein
MSDAALRNLLTQLHGALGGTTSIGEKDRELLEQLASDIQKLLATPGAPAQTVERSLLDRLESAVTRFEVSHPDLTATMSQVSKTLGDMGI